MAGSRVIKFWIFSELFWMNGKRFSLIKIEQVFLSVYALVLEKRLKRKKSQTYKALIAYAQESISDFGFDRISCSCR